MAVSGSVIGNYVGASVKRVEDPRFLTGQGRYIDDIMLPNMAYAAFLRSPYPHARITVDASEARALPGVIAVFTAADLAGVVNPILVDASLPGAKPQPHTALASDKVRFVGDPIAMVVAESCYVAEDAVDFVQVDYGPLPPVPNMEVALDPASTPLYEEVGDNIAYHDTFTYGDVDAAFSSADRVITETFRQHRYINVPMETRGSVATYDTATGELTYYAGTQAHNAMRFFLGAQLNLPGHRIRVIAPDIGGAFGLKFGVYREDMLVAAAAIKTGRPVKWIEDRRENLTAGGHAREETLTLDAAVKSDGTILGLKVKMTLDAGAYQVMPLNPALFTMIVRLVLPGPYRFQNYAFDATVVTTNKAPYVAYRGPWAVETWVREGITDIIAKELGLDPVEVRRKNIVTKEEQPYKSAVGIAIDRVSARETLERAVELADIPRFREEKKQVLQIAGAMLEASPDDLELANSMISVRGVPQKAIPLAQIAMLVYLAPGHLPPGSPFELVGTFAYDGGEGGWAQATHCCWVEINPQTGKVDITRYLVVEDCGTMINPAVVEGQVRGRTAQGIGGVLYEHAVYDDNAQFLTSTFMDYLVPTATEIPPIEIDHLETPPISPVNFRGVGERGDICAPPAIINAVSDALYVKITQQPLTPTRILELIGAIPTIPRCD